MGEPERGAEDRRRDRAGADAIDPDPALRQLHRDRPRELDHRGLGRAVDVGAPAAAQAGDAGGADDAAGALAAHDGSGVLHPEQDRAHEQRHGRVEPLDRDGLDPARDPARAGIVEETIEAAPAGHRQLDGGLDRALLPHVGARVGHGRAQLLREPPPPLVLHVGDDDLRAVRAEEPDRRLADPARPAGDHRHLALEPPHGHRPPRGRHVIARAVAAPARAACRFLRARKHFSGRPRSPLIIVRRDGQADQRVTFCIPLASQLL